VHDSVISGVSGPTSLLSAIRARKGAGIGSRATWTGRDLLVGIALAVLSLLMLGACIAYPAEAAFGKNQSASRAFLSLTILLWDGSLVLIVLWLTKRRGATPSDLGWQLPWQNETWSIWRIAAIIAVAYAAFWIVLIIYHGIVEQTGLENLLPDQQIQSDVLVKIWVLPIIGLSVVVGAPIAEELAFRGFVYGGLRRRFTVPVAALLSGLLFSLAHGQLGLIVPLTLTGAILALVYERTGSIWTSMSLHVLVNFVSLVVLVAGGGNNG